MYSEKSFNKYSKFAITKVLWYHPNAIGDKQKEHKAHWRSYVYPRSLKRGTFIHPVTLLEMNAKYITSIETSLIIYIISKDILDSWEIW